MMLDFLLAVVFFTAIVMTLVLAILAARASLLAPGIARLRINDQRMLHVPIGLKLLTTLEEAGIHLPSACGGKGSCGQCRIRLRGAGGLPTPIERALLTPGALRAGTRLACQLLIRHDLDIQLADEVYGVRRWRCRLRLTRFVGPLTKELTLELPAGESIQFKAGAFVQVSCPPFHVSFADLEVPADLGDSWARLGLGHLEACSRETQTRAYSLANDPRERRRLLLLVRLALPPSDAPADTPPGCVSSYLFSLSAGAEVEVAGPYGHFFARHSSAEMIFVGGGVGMAPLRSHILAQLKQLESRRRISFWYGARNRRELLYADEFRRLEEEHGNFHWHAALSAPAADDHWEGDVGLIHQVLHDRYLARHPNPEDCEYYLCGPPAMIRAVLTLLEQLGVDPENVSYDDFCI